MEAYSGFAALYDLFMEEVPYQDWAVFIRSVLAAEQIEDGLVLELGCGTGRMTELMAAAGYDLIGVDASAEMLQAASAKKADSGLDILYLLQDIREFELYGTVRAVISVCDVMNYLLEEEELFNVFCLVNNYLDPGGIFLFDLNTVYKYEQVIGDTVIAESREEGSFIWENSYDRETRINEYLLTLFVREEGGLYRRFEESHYQRAYGLETVRALLEKAGFSLEAVYEDFAQKPVSENSERVVLVAREKKKWKIIS